MMNNQEKKSARTIQVNNVYTCRWIKMQTSVPTFRRRVRVSAVPIVNRT